MPLQLHVAENQAVVAAEALHFHYWHVNLPMEVNNSQSSDSSESQIQEEPLYKFWLQDRCVGTDVGPKCFDTPSQTVLQNVVNDSGWDIET